MSEATHEAIIEAGDLAIRSLRIDEAPMLAEWFTDPEVYRRWWGHEDSPYEPHEIEGWFSLPGYRPDRFLIVEDAGVPVGFAQWGASDRAHLDANIHGFIEQSARGRGIGPRALRLLAEYIVERKGYYRAKAAPEPYNDAAIRTCERAGFRLHPGMPNGAWRGQMVYPRSRLDIPE